MPQGAATHVFLAASPDVKGISGKYFIDCQEEEQEMRVRVGWGMGLCRRLESG